LGWPLPVAPDHRKHISLVASLNTETHESSGTLQFEGVEPLGKMFALSMAYLNEGHFSDHHRDGVTGQLWVRHDVFDGRISLAAIMAAMRPAGPAPTTTTVEISGARFIEWSVIGFKLPLTFCIDRFFYQKRPWLYMILKTAG